MYGIRFAFRKNWGEVDHLLDSPLFIPGYDTYVKSKHFQTLARFSNPGTFFGRKLQPMYKSVDISETLIEFRFRSLDKERSLLCMCFTIFTDVELLRFYSICQ